MVGDVISKPASNGLGKVAVDACIEARNLRFIRCDEFLENVCFDMRLQNCKFGSGQPHSALCAAQQVVIGRQYQCGARRVGLLAYPVNRSTEEHRVSLGADLVETQLIRVGIRVLKNKVRDDFREFF